MQGKGSSKVRRAALGLVLERYPDSMTVGELTQEIGEGAPQVVTELVEAGLLLCEGEIVRASPAAAHFDAAKLP